MEGGIKGGEEAEGGMGGGVGGGERSGGKENMHARAQVESKRARVEWNIAWMRCEGVESGSILRKGSIEGPCKPEREQKHKYVD